MQMKYDYDYYSGKDLLYPAKPAKPHLKVGATSAEVREYANELERYEAALVEYNEHRDWYNSQTNLRLKELQDKLRDDYDITQAQFNVLWLRAWEDGHAHGLSEVVNHFDVYYDMASEFAALEKG
jgi:hypothetical protein